MNKSLNGQASLLACPFPKRKKRRTKIGEKDEKNKSCFISFKYFDM